MNNANAFKFVLDEMLDVIYIKNDQHQWVFANKAARQLFDLDQCEWYLKTSAEIKLFSSNLSNMELSQVDLNAEKKSMASSTLYKQKLKVNDQERYFERVISVIADQESNFNGLLTVIKDVTDSEIAIISLQESELNLKESKSTITTMSANKNKVRELCNKNLARELHDELGHLMAAMNMNINTIEPCSIESQQKIVTIKLLMEKANESIRGVITNLRPPILDLGIVATIEWQCADFMKMFGIQCRLNVLGTIPKLSEDININLYRILQETLTNISKHADATLVNISLSCTNSILNLAVSDNGIGFIFNQNTHLKSFGILGIKERAVCVGGIAQINSLTNKGSKVVVNIPIKQTKNSDMTY